MRNNLNKLEELLTTEILKNLRENGAIVFDVDDTLLARRKNIGESDQHFSESPAAVSVPQLLNAGVRVCVITGHGWAQLEKRFVLPLIEDVAERFPANRNEILQRLLIYANRGATKISWENGVFREDKSYGKEFFFEESDLIKLREIFVELVEDFKQDFVKQTSFFRQNFPKFAFDELPPKILERERVVLGLRPIPSESHCSNDVSESPRKKLFLLGDKLLKNAALDFEYEIAQSGKSTLEITRKVVSKKIALKDFFCQIAAEKGILPDTVEKSSIYVGDEFSSNGNDYIIAKSFPHCLCFSVASEKNKNLSDNTIIFFGDIHQLEGIPATSFLISHILKCLT